MTGPFLPMLSGRIPRFERIVGDTVAYLRSVAPDDLDGVRISIAAIPTTEQHREAGMDRWHLLPPHDVVLFRVPIERLARLSSADPAEYRDHVEQVVVFAVSELTGKPPETFLPDE